MTGAFSLITGETVIYTVLHIVNIKVAGTGKEVLNSEEL